MGVAHHRRHWVSFTNNRVDYFLFGMHRRISHKKSLPNSHKFVLNLVLMSVNLEYSKRAVACTRLVICTKPKPSLYKGFPHTLSFAAFRHSSQTGCCLQTHSHPIAVWGKLFFNLSKIKLNQKPLLFNFFCCFFSFILQTDLNKNGINNTECIYTKCK